MTGITTRIGLAPARSWWTGDPEALPVVEAAAVGEVLLVVRNFLSADQCGLLVDTFKHSKDQQRLAQQTEDFWRERVLWFDDIVDVTGRAKPIMQQARFASAYRISVFFKSNRLLYSDTQQLVHWGPGASMPVHVDNAHPTGESHPTPHRDFASVVYLNDDYAGGEVYFPLLGCRVRPEAGLLIGFPGDASAPHGVSRVESGDRYTMPGWYSTNPEDAEQSMLTIC